MKTIRRGWRRWCRRCTTPTSPTSCRTSPAEHRRAFVAIVRLDERPYVLAELDEAVRDEVIELLGVTETAAAVAGLETDDAVHVLEALDETDQRQVLEEIPQPERLLLEQALAYPEDSAGRLMQRELVAVPSFWTVGRNDRPPALSRRAGSRPVAREFPRHLCRRSPTSPARQRARRPPALRPAFGAARRNHDHRSAHRLDQRPTRRTSPSCSASATSSPPPSSMPAAASSA